MNPPWNSRKILHSKVASVKIRSRLQWYMLFFLHVTIGKIHRFRFFVGAVQAGSVSFVIILFPPSYLEPGKKGGAPT